VLPNIYVLGERSNGTGLCRGRKRYVSEGDGGRLKESINGNGNVSN